MDYPAQQSLPVDYHSNMTAQSDHQQGLEGFAIKRKQNSSCDACKLRRVKCDLLSQPSTSTGGPPSCSKCTAKGILCSTSRNQNRRPIKRTGARIEAAKAQFGTLLNETSAQASSSSGGSTPSEAQFLAFSESLPTTFNEVNPQPTNGAQPVFDSHLLFATVFGQPTSMATAEMMSTALQQYQSSSSSQPSLALDYSALGLPQQSSSFGGFNGMMPDPFQFTLPNQQSAEAMLFNGTLQRELSRHLINVFFRGVQYQHPVIDPTDFKTEFDAAGENVDLMSPEGKVMVSVMEAWGARYSGNPAIFGVQSGGFNQVGQIDPFQLIPGGEERSQWAHARETACRALLERAKKQLDETGLMRKPSMKSVQVLLLLAKLMSISRRKSAPSKEEYLEISSINSTACHQIRELDLTSVIDLSQGVDVAEALSQIRTSRVYWTAWVDDAFRSSARSCRPEFEEDEIVSNVPSMHSLSASEISIDDNFKGFLSMWGTFGSISRRIKKGILLPSQKPEKFSLKELSARAEEAWKASNMAYESLNFFSDRAALVFASAPASAKGFSPLLWLVSGKLCWSALYLILFECVAERLQYEKTKPKTASVRNQDSPDKEDVLTDVQICQAIQDKALRELLRAARVAARVVKEILHTGMLQTNCIVVDILGHIGKVLGEIPTIEQGFPLDPQGDHWTWEQKKDLVGACIEAQHQTSWAYSHATETIDEIKEVMLKVCPPNLTPWVYTPEYAPKFEESVEGKQIDFLLRYCRPPEAQAFPKGDIWPLALHGPLASFRAANHQIREGMDDMREMSSLAEIWSTAEYRPPLLANTSLKDTW